MSPFSSATRGARRNQRQGGFTLIEILVYSVIVVIVFTIIGALLVTVLEHGRTTGTSASVLDSARGTLGSLAHEIRRATAIYTPTSVFDTNPGQLSLVTRYGAPEGEEETYVDVYVDDGHLYLKREAAAAQLIIPEHVKVMSLVFTHLDPTSPTPSVGIALTMAQDTTDPDLLSRTTVTLRTTVALRQY